MAAAMDLDIRMSAHVFPLAQAMTPVRRHPVRARVSNVLRTPQRLIKHAQLCLRRSMPEPIFVRFPSPRHHALENIPCSPSVPHLFRCHRGFANAVLVAPHATPLLWGVSYYTYTYTTGSARSDRYNPCASSRINAQSHQLSPPSAASSPMFFIHAPIAPLNAATRNKRRLISHRATLIAREGTRTRILRAAETARASCPCSRTGWRTRAC